jgi:phage/plasmid-like protein (TIGR03299 family)
VLMTTTFDGSGATINQGTMTRTVCNNTLNVSLADKRAVVKTRHNTRFDAARVGKELAQIAQGFAQYKAIGDTLAQNEMAKEEVSNLFKSLLEIPFDSKWADVSTRKQNQFRDMSDAYRASVREGAPDGSAWAALNAITRYVDHDRSTRGGAGEDEARFVSAQFGSGAALKAQAVELLLPRIKDKVPVAA